MIGARRQQWSAVMMAHARAIALRSKDATTQVGACVAAADWTVLGTGFNGFPRGAPDDRLPTSGPGRHLWTLHAEYNALLHALATGRSLKGAKVFSTHRPCADCLKRCAHSGVRWFGWQVDELDEAQSAASDAVANMLGLYVDRYDAAGYDLRCDDTWIMDPDKALEAAHRAWQIEYGPFSTVKSASPTARLWMDAAAEARKWCETKGHSALGGICQECVAKAMYGASRGKR